MATTSQPATSNAAKAAPAPAKPKVARVRSLVGPMIHLHTNDVIGADEKKIEIDVFAQAQIDAGKWEIVAD